MKKEFVTSTGKVIIEKDILYIRRKICGSSFKPLIVFLVPLLFITRFILKLAEDESPKRNFGIFTYGLAAILSVGPLLYTIFKKSFLNRIPLNRIRSYKIEEDDNGLESHVILKLASGRERIISFRKLENQLVPFIESLSIRDNNVQLAS